MHTDFLSLTYRLARDSFLSQLEPSVVPEVIAINTILFEEQQILDLLNALYDFSLHTLEHLFHTQITACYLCIKDHLDKEATKCILIGALLHDIGKLLIPSSILSKPSSLTSFEWSIMKNHPIYSVKLLEPLNLSNIILDMVKYHHICYNGTGYPKFNDSLSPLGGDLKNSKLMRKSIGYLSMADAFDAMYHQRIYRDPYNISKISAEIKAGISRQFAPSPAGIILDALANLSIGKELFYVN